ncbi:heavy-metal-associated domain-containing protein [Thiomicrospira sp. ALE5]|uniref:heavy-metal-associated domain-containing protein n=1 Tax=Thiomicrospira sp. ALE5 TaxID=748650 RepID=UPI0008F2C578|nr:heavy metal-associated domain-containing protein [Thiomicrospira sp. ALE5]SFR48733.1 copper chaperone [Thiomicrospira sp. ALE5]
MFYSIEVENIKCGGCANQIKKNMHNISGVSDIKVELEVGRVEFNADSELVYEQVLSALAKMGYPKTGSVKGLDAATAKAKSFVSCAIGKVTKE